MNKPKRDVSWWLTYRYFLSPERTKREFFWWLMRRLYLRLLSWEDLIEALQWARIIN